MLRFFYIYLIAILLSACGGGGSSDPENTETTSTNDFSIYSYSTSSVIESCSNGGVILHFGFDENENGVLDNPEIDSNRDSTVCYGADGSDGTNGIDSLLKLMNEPQGENCTNGGIKVASGPDSNSNSILDSSEINNTQYVCNAEDGVDGTNGINGQDGSDGQDGTNGLDGIDGANGYNSLLTLTEEAAGDNCPNGGAKVTSGLDINSNDSLDTNETTSTQYMCNPLDGVDGSDGTNGYSSLLTLINEPAGENCPNGGIIAKSGLDINGNDNLDENEVTNSQYVCNGADLTETLIVLMVTSSEPPGSNCPAGGDKFSSGIDDNNDGTLQINEVDAVSYSCTVLSEYNTLTGIESAPTNICLRGGLITYVGLDYNVNGVLDTDERQSQTVSCASNEAPTITIPYSSYLANVNVAFSQSLPVSDADSDALSVTNATKPAWLSLNVIGNNVIASGTPSESDIGQYSVSFSITDSELSEEASFLLDTQAAPDNLGTFPYSTLELGEAGFSKIVDFEFADAAAFDRTVTFSAEASSTATESQDFNINYASQTVPAGETKTFFELEIINDTAYENIETIVINATVDAETVDQVTFSINDNTGYEILGSLPQPNSIGSAVISGEKVELNNSIIYDLNLEAVISYCLGNRSCTSIIAQGNTHKYLNNYFRYNDGTNKLEKYNFQSQSYEAISDLPTDCVDEMNTSFQNNKLYILGCQSEFDTSTGTMYSYNLLTDTWQLITNSGPNFVYAGSEYLWVNIIESNGVLFFYRGIFDKLLSYNLTTGFTQTETLSQNLEIFSGNGYQYLSTASKTEASKWIVPLYVSPSSTTKIVEFDPITKDEVVHEFNIGQNAGNGVIFHNGKWFYFGGTNNLGASDRVVSFILGDN